MKRLLILEDESEMGGVQHSTFNLLTGLLTDETVETLLLLPGEGSFAKACRKAQVNFEFYHKTALAPSSLSINNDQFRLPNITGLFRNISRSRRQVKTLIPILQRFQADLVLTKGMGAHINGGKACRKLSIPCVWHQQDFISERYLGAYIKWFGQLAKQYATYVIADGSPIRDQLPKAVQQNTKVVFNGVPLGEFYKPSSRNELRKELGIPQDSYVIGHLARITPWKGQHLLIEAFSEYTKTNNNAHLLLIGSPLFEGEEYWQTLNSLILQKGLSEKIHLPGYRTDLGQILSAIDTFIYPSTEKDTSPLALISALAAGLPAGVSNINGLKEMVENNEGVVLFENRNTTQMVEIIRKFQSAAARKKASSINRSWAQEHFSLGAYVTKMKQILIQVHENTL